MQSTPYALLQFQIQESTATSQNTNVPPSTAAAPSKALPQPRLSPSPLTTTPVTTAQPTTTHNSRSATTSLARNSSSTPRCSILTLARIEEPFWNSVDRTQQQNLSIATAISRNARLNYICRSCFTSYNALNQLRSTEPSFHLFHGVTKSLQQRPLPLSQVVILLGYGMHHRYLHSSIATTDSASKSPPKSNSGKGEKSGKRNDILKATITIAAIGLNGWNSMICKIGEGTYELIFLAKIKLNRSRSIAIKKFKQFKDGNAVFPTAIRKIMLLWEITHENVVKLGNMHINHMDMSQYLAFDYAKHDFYKIIRHHRDQDKLLINQYTIKSLLW
ncbi:hypothetical protein F0562_005942 [Nyssa sinensis]|uniref:Protein kinase domain-containing protein n=1 Tax=Nyssa sinensis TaxID=561372 RepID=A0A5J5AJN8_9ASTE|nr:hypothetical protein F0562_005942 [Nyssa sinensis]